MNTNYKLRSKPCRAIATAIFMLVTIVVLGTVGTYASAGEINPLSKPSVRAASEIDYPPFCTVDKDSRATGFSVELLRAALGAMGRDVSFRTGPWTQVRKWLEKGEVDALPLVGRTPERESVYDFTFALGDQFRKGLAPVFKNSMVAVRSSAPGEDDRGG